MNKKIVNATQSTRDGIDFKSKLEAYIYRELKRQGFNPLYEPETYTIWEGFKPTVPFFNRKVIKRKTKNNPLKIVGLALDTTKMHDITYTPDFSFHYKGYLVIIEAKGFENDVFPVKKKLFRKYLEINKEKLNPLYFEVYSKGDLLKTIEIIKSYANR